MKGAILLALALVGAAPPSIGQPKFGKAAFAVGQAEVTVPIRMRYLL